MCINIHVKIAKMFVTKLHTSNIFTHLSLSLSRCNIFQITKMSKFDLKIESPNCSCHGL